MTSDKVERHLIALDLDGTLLNVDRNISAQTKAYLLELRNQGHVIVITTGRPIRASLHYYDELGLDTPIICYNGTYIINPKDPSYPVTDIRFPKEVVKDILSNGSKKIIKNVMCETNKKIWITAPDDELSLFFWQEGMEIVYGDLTEILTEDPMTMLFKMYERTPETERLLMEKLGKYPHLRVRFWYTSAICETYYEGVSKGHAVLQVAKSLGIDEKHIIAFGDADNDAQLLSMINHSYSMKNGTELAKKSSRYVTNNDHNNDGIYHELKAYFSKL